MPEKTKTSGHGGQRKGAGRKSKLKDPVNQSVRLEKDTVKDILKKGHDVSTFLREAAERRLQEGW